MSNNIHIEWIDQSHRLLPDVMALGKKYAPTLGFMPEGGFMDHAIRKNIIISHDDDELQGYLMYRVGQRNSKVSIVHLCVKDDCRGKNISTLLLDALRDKYIATHSGISLSCRKDYLHPSKLWERYGFVCKRTIRSRSVEENYLNIWWYDFNQRDLFSTATTSLKVKALLDSNIVLKLRDNGVDHEPAQDPQVLLDDWLADEVEYYFAPEIFNEINRDKDKVRVQQTREFLNNFIETRANVEQVKTIANELKLHLPGNTDNDKSDRIQLATAIAGDISYFITFDSGILDKREEIENIYSIQIYSPQELILAIDQLLNREEYSPALIRGVSFHSISKVTQNELGAYVDQFLNKAKGEKKHTFNNVVSGVTSQLSNSYIKVVKDGNSPIAFYAHKFADTTLEIPFMRVSDTKHRQTIFMQLISDSVNEAVKRNLSVIVCKETGLDNSQMSVLSNLGFEKGEFFWQKALYDKLIASHKLCELDSRYDLSAAGVSESKNKILIDIERKLFPLKFNDLDIPTYIIPIQSLWAGQLFDHNISGITLFGAEPDKLWNIENVYYRSTKPINERAPARILWYVSADKKTHRSKSIVASSYLNEVMTGKPKELYNKNKHYGIYEWRHIYKLCKQDVETPIRALRFGPTEVFSHPVKYDRVLEILAENKRKTNTFASPVQVDHKIFNQIYSEGKWRQ